MLSFLIRESRNLYPGYFAMVMATGALSIACWYLDFNILAEILIYFNVVIFISLLLLNIIRISFNKKNFLDDLSDHSKGPGFFTLIAGTEVLGSQLVIIKDFFTAGLVLWIAGLMLWFILMYMFFTVIIVKQVKPVIEKAINGGWLLAVVSTESLAVLGALIAPYFSDYNEVILFIALCVFLLGAMLYLNIIAVIFYRLMFLEVDAMSLTPPYWINMGALAITTLAGSVILIFGTESDLVSELLIFIKGFILSFWALGTWWIPLLITLGIWRHISSRYPLTYDSSMWGMAFPIAMYTAGTTQLSVALDLEFLMIIPRITIYFSMIVWMLILTGMIIRLVNRYFRREG